MINVYFHNKPIAVRIAEGFLFPVIPPWMVSIAEENVTSLEEFSVNAVKLAFHHMRLEARHALN